MNYPQRQRVGPSFGWGLTPMVRALLIATAACYAAELIAINWFGRSDIVALFSLVPSDVIRHGYVWQVLTYLWLHDPYSPWHLLLNLFGLYMFGGPMERRWGARPFLRFYLITGGLAGLVVVGAGWLFYPDVATIGCSGAVLALAAAFGIAYAEAPVFLFGILPMRARTLLLVIVGFVAFDWLTRRQGISVAGHAGGLAAGALLVTGWWRPSRIRRAIADRRGARARVRFERHDGEGPKWMN